MIRSAEGSSIVGPVLTGTAEIQTMTETADCETVICGQSTRSQLIQG